MSLIALQNAGYKYPSSDAWVFRHFDMVIDAGQTLRIAGRNGAGKSTLLKVLSGLLEIQEGKHQAKAFAAYMDQYASEMLAPGLTIGEQFKVAAEEVEIEQLISLLGDFGLDLDRRISAFIGHLSGGQRQIVALLCTLASGATVLCLDEFTSALDERSVLIAERILQHMVDAKKIAIVLVSHSGTKMRIDRELEIPST